MDWVNIVVSILSGLAVVIPLVIELVKYVEKAAKEKNWADLLALVTNLMKEAETKFETGADRREWVLMMVKASADTINYDIDLSVVDQLISDLCEMSKVVNAPSVKEEAE